MFYEQISLEEIPFDIRDCYEKEVKPYIGQLVIHNHVIYRLVGLFRDDKFDSEWCYRFLVFPSEYEWRRAHFPMDGVGMTQVSNPSILCGIIIPLKGFLSKEHYNHLEESWKMNEERCPYSKDYNKYE